MGEFEDGWKCNHEPPMTPTKTGMLLPEDGGDGFRSFGGLARPMAARKNS